MLGNDDLVGGRCTFFKLRLKNSNFHSDITTSVYH